MPNSVKYIGNGAFRKLYIESLTLSNSLEVIEDRAFDGCRHFTFTSLAIPNTVKVIGKSAFCGCDFQNLTIGNSVEYIGDFAFDGCRSLTNLTIPNSVILISKYAFDDCTSLKSVTLGNVDLIDDGAFIHCNALTTVTFPKDPIIFGDEVFFDTAIDPNSMSWPAPTHKSDWMVVDDQGNKVKKIKWGMKDCYAYWLKNEKVYFGGVGEDILNIGDYLNYEDLEAAIFFKIYCDKLRTRGKKVNNNNSNSNNKSTGKSTGKATGKSTGKATGKTNTVRKRR